MILGYFVSTVKKTKKLETVISCVIELSVLVERKGECPENEVDMCHVRLLLGNEVMTRTIQPAPV